MRVHNWSKLFAGLFHDFHSRWIVSLSEALNTGLLPSSYYAMAEQVAGGPRPDILTLEQGVPETEFNDYSPENQPEMFEPALEEQSVTHEDGQLLTETKPLVRFTVKAEETLYTEKRNRVAIRHMSDDRIVAVIEIISPGNKQSPKSIEFFNEKVLSLLQLGKHFLMIDVLPPGKADPRGMHAALWESAFGETVGVTSEEPIGCVAYHAERDYDVVDLHVKRFFPTAYFERCSLVGPLPTMPLFLTDKMYVNVPLTDTYAAAFKGVPERWKKKLEAID
jgi:Protein of unknown function (DUF4058)